MSRLIVVAGPPGGGKSTALGAAYFGMLNIPYFNVDERCKELNGSARNIPIEIRVKANQDLKEFCHGHIEAGTHFAFETTLRQDFAIRMGSLAKTAGFDTELHYIAAAVGLHVARVTARALAGGHAASERRLREMYAASMGNLRSALIAFEHSFVYDSTAKRPRLFVEARQGQLVRVLPPIPPWAHLALKDLLTR